MRFLPITLACCAGLLLAAPDIAAERHRAAAPAEAEKIDPDAMAALDKMGAELRSHQTFELKSDVTNEDVLADGQKLQYQGTVEMQARRPDRFKIEASSDLRDRVIYYDGKKVTVFSPRLGYYASFDAPPTIRETLQQASDKYGIEIPLSDMFAWGTDPSMTARIKSAFLVRPEHINGQLCNHYAFRGEKADFQIWIQQNGPALPCKLVITNRSDASMPQYTSVMHWSFPDSIPDNVFAFEAPSNAKKIMLATLNPGGAGGALKGLKP
jgi:hypothetical protein